jgi:hypothetical protein
VSLGFSSGFFAVAGSGEWVQGLWNKGKGGGTERREGRRDRKEGGWMEWMVAGKRRNGCDSGNAT